MDRESQSGPQGYPPERIELLKKHISGWLRQSRYRGRKSGVIVDITLQDILDIYEAENYQCSYCGRFADSPDHPFPIRERGPCIQANIVPCCNACRERKSNHNLIKFYQGGGITADQLQALIKKMVGRRGGDKIKEYIKTIYSNKEH